MRALNMGEKVRRKDCWEIGKERKPRKEREERGGGGEQGRRE